MSLKISRVLEKSQKISTICTTIDRFKIGYQHVNFCLNIGEAFQNVNAFVESQSLY